MNMADGEQTVYPKSLSSPQGSHRDSGSPFLTLWAWLPSTLGKYPSDPELGAWLTLPGTLAGLNASSQGLMVNHGPAF